MGTGIKQVCSCHNLNRFNCWVHFVLSDWRRLQSWLRNGWKHGNLFNPDEEPSVLCSYSKHGSGKSTGNSWCNVMNFWETEHHVVMWLVDFLIAGLQKWRNSDVGRGPRQQHKMDKNCSLFICYLVCITIVMITVSVCYADLRYKQVREDFLTDYEKETSRWFSSTQRTNTIFYDITTDR